MRGYKEVWTRIGFVHVQNDLVNDFLWRENQRAQLNLMDNNITQVNVLWGRFDEREERIERLNANYDALLAKARRSRRQLNFVQKRMVRRGIDRLNLKEM